MVKGLYNLLQYLGDLNVRAVLCFLYVKNGSFCWNKFGYIKIYATTFQFLREMILFVKAKRLRKVFFGLLLASTIFF